MTVGELREQLRGYPKSFEMVMTINDNGIEKCAVLKVVNPLPYSQRVELLGEVEGD
jgi:hypothetical protein